MCPPLPPFCSILSCSLYSPLFEATRKGGFFRIYAAKPDQSNGSGFGRRAAAAGPEKPKRGPALVFEQIIV